MNIKELILETASLAKARLFYHKTLELAILKETEDVISFQAGKSVLTFRQISTGKPVYHFAFNIVNNKFSDAFDLINSKLDILPVEDDMLVAGYDNWNAQSFYFHDNNGNILEFIVRFDLPYYSNEPFSSNCITDISEIGLVIDNPEEKAVELNSTYGIPYFLYGPHLHDFIAMGDNYGLILLSAPGRKWVPTNKPARQYPVTIITENGQSIGI